MAEISHWALGELLAKAPRAVSAPRVNLGPVLGTPHVVHVGLHDVAELLETGEPAFDISLDDKTLTVRRQDGGLMATLEIKL